MITAIADTHAVIWYLADDPHLSKSARVIIDSAANDGDQIAVSAITLVEVVYLVEKQRISALQFTQLATELRNPDSLFVDVPVTLEVARALSGVDGSQIPDMPDRIIAATATHLGVLIISRDRRIVLLNLQTIW